MTDDPRKVIRRQNRSLEAFKYNRKIQEGLRSLEAYMKTPNLEPLSVANRTIRMPDGSVIQLSAILTKNNQILVPQYKVSVVPYREVTVPVRAETGEQVLTSMCRLLLTVHYHPVAENETLYHYLWDILESPTEIYLAKLETFSTNFISQNDLNPVHYVYQTSSTEAAEAGASKYDYEFELGGIDIWQSQLAADPTIVGDDNLLWGEMTVGNHLAGSNWAKPTPTSKLQDNALQSRYNYSYGDTGVQYQAIDVVRQPIIPLNTVTWQPGRWELANPYTQRNCYGWSIRVTNPATGERFTSADIGEDRIDAPRNWEYYVPIMAISPEETLLRHVTMVGGSGDCYDSTLTETLSVGSTLIRQCVRTHSASLAGMTIIGPSGMNSTDAESWELDGCGMAHWSISTDCDPTKISVNTYGAIATVVTTGASGSFTLSGHCETCGGGDSILVYIEDNWNWTQIQNCTPCLCFGCGCPDPISYECGTPCDGGAGCLHYCDVSHTRTVCTSCLCVGFCPGACGNCAVNAWATCDCSDGGCNCCGCAPSGPNVCRVHYIKYMWDC